MARGSCRSRDWIWRSGCSCETVVRLNLAPILTLKFTRHPSVVTSLRSRSMFTTQSLVDIVPPLSSDKTCTMAQGSQSSKNIPLDAEKQRLRSEIADRDRCIMEIQHWVLESKAALNDAVLKVSRLEEIISDLPHNNTIAPILPDRFYNNDNNKAGSSSKCPQGKVLSQRLDHHLLFRQPLHHKTDKQLTAITRTQSQDIAQPSTPSPRPNTGTAAQGIRSPATTDYGGSSFLTPSAINGLDGIISIEESSSVEYEPSIREQSDGESTENMPDSPDSFLPQLMGTKDE